MELAKKKGDRDAEARYSHPKLYAEGFSQEAKAFNCHQRAHQQALETYPNFVVCSIIGGMRHPLLTSLAGLLYIVARVKWAKGYATGDPMNRYRASGGWAGTFGPVCSFPSCVLPALDWVLQASSDRPTVFT